MNRKGQVALIAVTFAQVSVQAVDGATQAPSSGLDAVLDTDTGADGDVLTLTLTRTARASSSGDVLFVYSADKKEFWSDTILVTN